MWRDGSKANAEIQYANRIVSQKVAYLHACFIRVIHLETPANRMTPAGKDCVNVKILTLLTAPVDSLKGRSPDYQVLVSARNLRLAFRLSVCNRTESTWSEQAAFLRPNSMSNGHQ